MNYLKAVTEVIVILLLIEAAVQTHDRIWMDNTAYASFIHANPPVWLPMVALLSCAFLALWLLVRRYAASVLSRRVGRLPIAVEPLLPASLWRTAGPDLRPSHWLRFVLFGLLAAAAFSCLNGLSFVSARFPELHAFLTQFMSARYSPLVPLALLIGVPFEELVFRGLIMRRLLGAFPFAAALIVQALLTAALQPGLAVMALGCALGIAYGFVFRHWGTLWPTIVMALSFNLALFALFQSGVITEIARLSDKALGLLLPLIMLAAALLIAELLRPAGTVAVRHSARH
ncbi:CPBP family intramembrane metalloprotease [Paenibacillus athensensis]|uniref:CAAX prenyl protease 2/Lysostaphin resistance protein A-like domain-containing protein n=1 Tax=Paenibacillus athensensis TaxID=1967502 RepID=A0A4Y8Q279_9BACL|nr:type II CAAX endopeptidase family protein [Paenibacillus athensensis]MCD1258623.1 CPBP family intramembrane metalloprotease [Paenibacillus athensensis]